MQVILKDMGFRLPAEKRAKRGSACTMCRKKKRRCDAIRPVCTLCIDGGEPAQCAYTTMRVTPRTPTLQRRIDDLETQIEILQAGLHAARIEPNPSTNRREVSRVAAPPAYLARTPSSRENFAWSPPPSTEGSLKAASHQTPGVPFPGQLEQSTGGISSLVGSWWSTDEPPPCGIIDTLIAIFKKQEHRHTHDPRPSEFYALLYDPGIDTGIHPALKNSIFLLACNRQLGPLAVLEPVFFRRTIHFLQEALARADRLLDFIEASFFLALYHAYKGRLLQATESLAATIQFAAACGLHVVRPPEWHPVNRPSLLPRTNSRAEIQRRIRIWWTLFTSNRVSSLSANVESAVDAGSIETVWEIPTNLDQLGLEHCHGTVSSLFLRGSHNTYVYNNTANAIRSKCVALAERAARLGFMAASASGNNRAFWEEFEIADYAIQRVTSSLPSIHEETRYEVEAAHMELQGSRMNHFAAVYHFLTCDATICLHSQLARAGSLTSREACLDACWRVMPMVRHMLEHDTARSAFQYLPMVWMRMFGTFCTEYDLHVAARDYDKAQFFIPELKALTMIIRAQGGPLTHSRIAALKSRSPSLQNEPGVF
ncbi:hypothetical protein BOTBODRAFT_206843 [Botryobasidium botryosum FD-172 SS1]|uniref:Zn(2)-C6 fungal-type domain-containing protein n=1 Tax=Botryobasidium botryosum (strain FD-172 SS1) TaxID=930990 RepID=A0A067NCP0_BOTB1|nr:hypothetical protein BOTBODRAFT_206843 [Botryobasidium botryosum FD-172 SS1]